MARLTYAQRKALPDSAFAWPEARELPLIDKHHVKNAAARLSMMMHKGTIDEISAGRAHARILAAEKHYGVGRYRIKKQRRRIPLSAQHSIQHALLRLS